MSYQTTWPGLKADMLLKLEDQSDEVLAVQDGIIAEAELQVLRDLDLEIFVETFNAGNLTIGNRLFARYSVVKINNLWLQAGTIKTFVEKRERGYCDMWAPDSAVRAVPTFWAEAGEANIMFVDTPVSVLAVWVDGISRPPGLGPTVNTTWLSLYAADLLLLAALINSEEFLSSTGQVAAWKAEYADRLGKAKIELRGLARSTYEMARMAGQAGNPL